MVIKRGSQGAHVKSFQEFLIVKEFLHGIADGIAGPKTHEAIKLYQGSRGLVSDGIAGAKTLSKAKEEGWSHSEEPTKAQEDAAEALGIPVRVVQTIEKVESAGKADAIRFEPHVFLRKRPDLEQSVPFTKGPKGFSVTRAETNRSAFEYAFLLDPEAAVASTSWGLYQVMGQHLLDLYGSANSAADHFYSDPEGVSYELFVKWFEASPRALAAAKTKDWENLARYYNGPGNVEKYSALLSKAYLGLA
tara:strand:- start:6768 stop:7511 length:744 start_codon:yes stop_codon:yes gene_type:complete